MYAVHIVPAHDVRDDSRHVVSHLRQPGVQEFQAVRGERQYPVGMNDRNVV